ncbi:MAG: MopE-related protein [Pseudomonadota bacterium]
MRRAVLFALFALPALACDRKDGLDTSDPQDSLLDDSVVGDTADTGIDTHHGNIDADGDGWTIAEGDCDDTDATVYPGAEELCDGKDNDCDGVSDADFDDDKDGIADCEDYCPIQVDITAASGGDGSFERPFQVVQDGIDAAPATGCWEVDVRPGHYLENIDFRGYPVDVRATGGPSVTVLDGQGLGPVVTFHTDEPPDARLYGFTVTGGLGERGAGISVIATSAGAECSPTLEANVITGNATTAGGVGAGIALKWSRAEILGNTIQGNDACLGGPEDGCDGGGIYVLFGAPIITLNTIAENTAGDGGGLWVAYADAVITQNLIVGNRADDEGVTDDNDFFIAGQGGGVILHTATDGALLASNVIADNTASTHGGGLVVYGTYEVAPAPTVSNNTFAFNTVIADDHGAGVEVWGIAAPALVNNILYGNHGAGFHAQYAYTTVTYGDVYGNDMAWSGALADPTGSDGNLAVDPRFTAASDDGDWTNDDYHLGAGSPVVDVGDPAIYDADGSRSDLGAFGGPGGSW